MLKEINPMIDTVIICVLLWDLIGDDGVSDKEGFCNSLFDEVEEV